MTSWTWRLLPALTCMLVAMRHWTVLKSGWQCSAGASYMEFACYHTLLLSQATQGCRSWQVWLHWWPPGSLQGVAQESGEAETRQALLEVMVHCSDETKVGPGSGRGQLCSLPESTYIACSASRLERGGFFVECRVKLQLPWGPAVMFCGQERAMFAARFPIGVKAYVHLYIDTHIAMVVRVYTCLDMFATALAGVKNMQ